MKSQQVIISLNLMQQHYQVEFISIDFEQALSSTPKNDITKVNLWEATPLF
jgi:hypothetical protein